MSAKCHLCGAESIVEEAYCKIKESSGNRTTYYCPSCWKKASYLIQSTMAVRKCGCRNHGGILVALDSSIGFGWILLNLFFLQVFIFLGTILHELGHGSAARAMGLRLFRI